MSTGELLIRLAAGVVLTGLNAFFVVTEFALTRLRQLPEEEFEGERRLRLAWKMTEKLEIYLTGCQLGITSTSILLGVVAEPAVTSLLRPLWDAVGLGGGSAATASVITSVVIINLIHKIWGEQAPTYLGVERPLQVARWTAPAHYWWTKIMYPVILFGDGAAKLTLRAFGVRMQRSWVEPEEGGGGGGADRGGDRGETDEAGDAADGEGGGGGGGGPGGGRGGATRKGAARADVRRAMGEILARGGVAPDRRREVMRALEIDELPVREIMVPRGDIVALEAGAPAQENLRRIGSRRHTRYPLVGASLDDYRGVVYLAALLADPGGLRRGTVELERIAAPPVTVSPELPVSALVDRLQAEEQELALVREDDNGPVLGLVTITDAFEAIIGDLRDPLDA